ncbi:substrate-binding periplasmic protein [Rhabdochlamydiaceae symbiont of Dictyostelium giganteum]|uniref:substrate-binding periplasmic protein n=1 Tax=Rhabdochlamydiaceae symbiont of Dictyostelium giganteum TaxID=3342349 RepID=UPI00384ACB84
MRLILSGILLFTSLFAKETFVIGTTSGYAPFVSLTIEGSYEGFDIDMAELIAKKLGKTVVIKDYGSMAGLMLALKQQKVDALLWAISITKERQEAMHMIYYQGEKISEISLLYKGDQNLSYQEFIDKKVGAICVEAGTFQEAALVKSSPFKLKQVTHIADAILELRYGKCQGVAIDKPLIKRFQEQYPEFKVLSFPLPESEASLGNGICIKHQNTALIEQVKIAVEELIQEGSIAKLEKKWGLEI